MKKEVQILLSAFSFYTRFPVYKWVEHDREHLHLSTKYLPVVGWVVGGLSATIFVLTNFILSDFVAIVFSLITSVLITGAFHEDGLADTCDGFGGGWTQEKILHIMKDSRVGAYGVISLILMFTLKVSVLLEAYAQISGLQILLFTISGHTVSRFTASTFLFTHSYARVKGDSKVRLVTKKSGASILLLASVFTLIPLLGLSYFSNNYFLVLSLIPVFGIKYFLGKYFNKWIGGYTGDCLGATQQITELAFYISVIMIWKFI